MSNIVKERRRAVDGQAHEKLRRSEERYGAIFEYAPVSIWVEDYSGVKELIDDLKAAGVKDFGAYLETHPEFIEQALKLAVVKDVNRATIELYKAKDKNELTRPLNKILKPSSVFLFKEQLIAIAAGKTSFETECVSENLRGEKINIHFKINFPPPEEKYDNLLVCISDITARKQVEDHLKENQNLLNSIIESLPFNLFALDKNNRYILQNSQCRRNWGNITGKSSRDIPGVSADEKKIWAKNNLLALSGETVIREVERSEGGEKRYYQNTVAPIYGDGDVKGVLGMDIDITEQKEIDRAKSEFVSLASHQLRTPLSSISLSAELLLRGVAGELSREQAGYLGDIYEDVFKMSELITALLNISKIEMGTFVAEPEPAEITDIIDYSLSEVEAQAKNKKIAVVKNIAKGTPTIEVDKNIIYVVMQNLLHNSIKYTPAGGKIKIDVKKSGNSVVLSVKDNGIGIPAHQQKNVFSKYFRADNVKKIEASGTGLGLYISKSLLEEVGGKIWFESKTGQGTSFTFSIPIKAAKKETRSPGTIKKIK